MTLEAQHKHLLRLARKDPDADGWVNVSATMMPIVRNHLPTDLVEIEDTDNGRGRIRLTERGHAVADYA